MEAPPSFFCPIGMEIMSDPVICASGHTYERTNIERWLTTKNTSPSTGVQLRSRRLIPNYALRDSIEEWLRAKVEADTLEDILEATRCEREVANIIEQLALRQELTDTKKRLEQEKEDDETRYNQDVASLSQKLAYTKKRLELKARREMWGFAYNKAELEREKDDVKARCNQEVARLSQELAYTKARLKGEKTETEARSIADADRKMRLEGEIARFRQEFADNKAVKARYDQELARLSQELADTKTRLEGGKIEAVLVATMAGCAVVIYGLWMGEWNGGHVFFLLLIASERIGCAFLSRKT